ncbi:ZYRO0F14322p [Zygosaccharomyces rouxii]|uniref:ZYRO0F14322p n=1 Tax=Zygosaccharomyces rouxii (strain ATCC 2623 / CBS 732 / NBRC 1130 / NCYC 568 / NRRL Y-229) TaxID=559307 RepID=C5DYM9_ZYGRC|nr:uncharacterized protein ZYRO0F14322g [Zygosaccharomyces rouxii]KAH9199646.1 putative Sin3 binding protein-domain-containing protein [Zygosaccharomyces rouxii]CAR28890.1 ZYRO0F14322p [Zygosaccharomyces rouxii]
MSEIKKEHSPKLGVPKPISTSSPAGLAAAQMVTPGKLSSLLLEKGPLAIRHITQTLGTEIPSFKDLSSSKQRRLIMSAMEIGDQEHSVVFEKIGWGQWTAKPVAHESFIQERDATNIANAKVKDIVSQESQRRRSSSSNGAKRPQLTSKRSSALSGPAFTASSSSPTMVPQDEKIKQEPHEGAPEQEKERVPAASAQRVPAAASQQNILYIDENALASDDDEEDDEAIADEEDEDEEEEEEGEEGEEFLKHRLKEEDDKEDPYSFRRRKSSVVWTDHPSEDMEHELLARRVRPFLQNRSRRSSSKVRNPLVSKPSIHLDFQQPPQQPRSRQNSNPMIDLEQITNSISEPTSRRESRVSFSKESSIRSTLLPHKSYLWSNTRQDRRKLHHGRRPNGPNSGEHAYSDTDEEDWASIGAASLRNNSVPPRMDTVSTSPNGFVAPTNPSDTASIPNIDEKMTPDGSRNKENQERRPARSADDNNAAFLLMSLKS